MKYLMRNDLEDSYSILSLQNCILNIAEYIDDICDKFSIEYCLMGGSALGAIRHQGFIPWDDDLDIFMTPDNYERFRSVHKNLNGFYLQEWGNKNGKVTKAKLRLDKSTYIEEIFEEWDIHHGVFVDIFILHVCPDNKIKQYWQYFWAKYILTKGVSIRGERGRKGVKGLLMRIASILPNDFLLNYALEQVYRYRNAESKYYCHFMGKALLKNGLYKREYFKTVKKVQFENTKLCVPIKVEEYLIDRWGDYMKLPSIEEINKSKHCLRWSDTEYFSSYKENGNYNDEKYLIA